MKISPNWLRFHVYCVKCTLCPLCLCMTARKPDMAKGGVVCLCMCDDHIIWELFFVSLRSDICWISYERGHLWHWGICHRMDRGWGFQEWQVPWGCRPRPLRPEGARLDRGQDRPLWNQRQQVRGHQEPLQGEDRFQQPPKPGFWAVSTNRRGDFPEKTPSISAEENLRTAFADFKNRADISRWTQKPTWTHWTNLPSLGMSALCLHRMILISRSFLRVRVFVSFLLSLCLRQPCVHFEIISAGENYGGLGCEVINVYYLQ